MKRLLLTGFLFSMILPVFAQKGTKHNCFFNPSAANESLVCSKNATQENFAHNFLHVSRSELKKKHHGFVMHSNQYFESKGNIYTPSTYDSKLTAHEEQSITGFKNIDADSDGGVDIQLADNMWLNLGVGYYEGETDIIKDPLENYSSNSDSEINVKLLFAIK